MKTFEIYPYQKSLSTEHVETLYKYNILYYVMQQRVGKTITAFLTIQKYFNKYKTKTDKVLFVTGKRIIPDIELDLKILRKIFKKWFTLSVDIINYDMLHTIDRNNDYNYVVVDEPQTLGAFPKPNLRAKQLKEIVQQKLLILLSGTPTPESYSQIYHQLYISMNSPFKQWDSFYSWVRAGFVEPTEIIVTGRTIKIYKNAIEEKIFPYIKKFMITYTQEEAGFTQEQPTDVIRLVPQNLMLNKLIKKLVKDRYYKFKTFDGEIICDTAVSLQQKIHQISSGTIIVTHPTETNTIIKKIHDPVHRKKIDVEIEEPVKIYKILDESKADFIQQEYQNKKIAIFYKFISEGTILENRFNTTIDHHEFNRSKDLVFISQFRSGARGINIGTADIIIAYNIDFSYEIYSQFRQRLVLKDRITPPEIHWLFTSYGIEDKIYSRVLDKESYTTTYFQEDYVAQGKVNSKKRTEELSIKNAVYKLTMDIQKIDVNQDIETLRYVKKQFIKTGLLEEEDFTTPFGKRDMIT